MLSLLLISVRAIATAPPPLPDPLPPLKTAPVAHPQAAPPVGPPTAAPPLSVADIQRLNLSSAAEADLIAHFFQQPIAGNNEAAPVAGGQSAVTRGRRHVLAPNTTVGTTPQVTSDASADEEPAIITNLFTENGTNVNRTTLGWTKLSSSFVPSLYWATTSNDATFVGFPAGTAFLLPPGSGADRSSNAMLSENPYGLGAFPKRTYCVGISYNIDANWFGHSVLTVWYSDNLAAPGNPWTILPVDTADDPIFLDKPSIATSWDGENGTTGYTYIAVMVIHHDTQLKDIQVYRQSTATGFTLVNRQFLYLDSSATSPIITVDKVGDVYLLWTDPQQGIVEIARSIDMGNTFTDAIPFSAPSQLIADNTANICDNVGNNCVRASTALMAKPNFTDGSIGVVWHLHESDGRHTDIGFNRFYTGSQAWTWFRGIQIGHVGANDGHDQWNPALDAASDGSYIVQWYDKRNDANNQRYQVFAEKVHPDGTAIDAMDTLVYNGAAADPAFFLSQNVQGTFVRYMGDYQDLWYWTDAKWRGGTIYTGSSQYNEDVWMTQVTP